MSGDASPTMPRRSPRHLTPGDRAGRNCNATPHCQGWEHGSARQGPVRQRIGRERRLVVHYRRRAVLPLQRVDAAVGAGESLGQRSESRSSSASSSRLISADRSPASGSTREPATPARTSAICGRSLASCLRAPRYGRDRHGLAAGELSRRRSRSPRTRFTSRRISRRTATMLATTFSSPTRVSTTFRCILLRDGVSGGNGVYDYGSVSTFPNSTFQATNYWVDVVFTTGSGGGDTTPPTVTATSPAQWRNAASARQPTSRRRSARRWMRRRSRQAPSSCRIRQMRWCRRQLPTTLRRLRRR